MALANVALTNTFDEWRVRTNQLVIKTNDMELTGANSYNVANLASANASAAFEKANSANVLAYNTGIGANAFASATISGANTAVGTGANAFTSATIAGANTAVGAGANNYLLAVIAGANTAVGTGANAFASATIAGANTAVGTGANNYLLAVIAGANTAVGAGANAFASATVAGANAFTSATVAGANTAVGTGANSYLLVVIAGANTAVGAGANNWANTKVSSVTGTVNQISVTGTTGVTLSTPQSIATSSNVQFGSFGVGTAASGTTGEIRATNNITAYYSDKRLKEQIAVIDDAMNKLKQISGIYYKPNDIAKSYGYRDENEHVGVLAQEVQEVLPHAVKGAPFDTIFVNEKEVSISGENYLTVQYEKLIPLLIEAIKELERKVNDLTKRT